MTKSYPVKQWTLKGEFIKEYPSAPIAEIETGINNMGITSACRRNVHSSGGFLWTKADELPVIPGPKKRMTIDIFTTHGMYVRSVKGIREAATFCKVSQANVSSCLHGYIHTCGGFVLRKGEDV